MNASESPSIEEQATPLRVQRAARKRYSLHSLSAASLGVDLLVIVFCAPAISLLIQAAGLSPSSDELQVERMAFGLLAGLVYCLFSTFLEAYRPEEILKLKVVLPRILKALLLTFGSFILAGAALKTTQTYSRIWFFSWVSFATIVISSLRFLQLRIINMALRNGSATIFQAYSVGFQCAPLSAREVASHRGCHIELDALLRIEHAEQLTNIVDAVRNAGHVDHIYIRAPWATAPDILPHMEAFQKVSAEVLLIPEHTTITKHACGFASVGGQLALIAQARPIEGWEIWCKRAFDIVVSLLVLSLTSPVLLLAALAIAIESGRPIIFRQKRVGLDGRVFELYKFRSMYADKADAHAMRQTSRNDPRVTRVGRYIRATSLDEFPQFFNVLRGEMSVVGPRPHALKTSTEGQLLDEVTSIYGTRHRVKPGITGLAQVNGCRGELDTVEKVHQRVAYDIEYIENWSLWLDFKIVIRTVFLVLRDPSAF